MNGITFYPEIRYRGYRAYVWGNWHPESSEPLLSIYIPSHEVTVEGDATENVRRGQELMDAGLAWNGREAAVGYVHVDDLEKTPGSPPEEVL